ncbi:hypothetical protein T439DRAFT_384525 [Meredithblackwellia eburnea MCA 4105]
MQRPLAPAPPSNSSISNTTNNYTNPNQIDHNQQQLQQPPPLSLPTTPSSASLPSHSHSQSQSQTGKTKKPRRSKVAEACRFCRRSHMSCDAGRPCGRCVKRDIAHLCREEPLTSGSAGTGERDSPGPASATVSRERERERETPVGQTHATGGKPTTSFDPGASGSSTTTTTPRAQPQQQQPPNSASLTSLSTVSQPDLNFGAGGGAYAGMGGGAAGGGGGGGLGSGQLPLLTSNFNLAMLDLASGQEGLGAGLGLDMTLDGTGAGGGGGHEGGEFHGLGLSEFLQSLHDSPFLSDAIASSLPQFAQQPTTSLSIDTSQPPPPLAISSTTGDGQGQGDGGAPISRRGTRSQGNSVPGSPINKTERFLLTAADQKDGSRSDRLARVIHAKFEAGLLRPYNHVAGYTRLMRWMADNMSPSSRQRTLQTLSEFRPAFRAIASSLTDLDLVFIEEAFERLLLDYDRVFSSMGIPSCLWRRTGEIYKGNKEFAALVGVPIEHLQGGKLAIYELMAEESAVNYWEKYGNIAFDAGQKAVLTSCVLVNQSVLSRKRKKAGSSGDKAKYREEAMINCCFSFTIRRDSYAIPSMIVGNFLRF